MLDGSQKRLSVVAGSAVGRFRRSSSSGSAPVTGRSSAPLTERVLAWLPGPRAVWVLAWALVPWLNLAAIAVADAAPWAGQPVVPTGEVLNRAAVSFAVLLSLWGASRICRELQALPARLATAVTPADPDLARLFHGIASVAGPVALTLLVGAILPLDEALRGDAAGALIQAGTWLLIGIPLTTAFWVYLVLQIGLIRLGRGHVALKGYRGDPGLGLRPVGNLAFTAFWMLFGSVGPLVLTGLTDVPVTAVGLAVLMAATGLFFFSFRDLHRQMVSIKQAELDRARELYRQAYERVAADPRLEMLQEQAGLLSAADSLEKRADRIQEWLFDEGTLARVLTIFSSAVATILARLILAPTGL